MLKNFIPLLKSLSQKEFSTDQNIIKNYCIDWRGKFKGTTELILFPKSVKSVEKIVKFCFEKKIAIVPQEETLV